MRLSTMLLSFCMSTLSLTSVVDAEFVERSSVPRLNAPHPQAHRQATSTECGDNLTCLNGGSCMQGQLEHYANNTKPLCNCKTAIMMEDNPNSPGDLMAVQYVGKTCNIKVDQHHYCGGDADLFCVNGGTCRTQAKDYERNPCKCTANYAGRHCEYEASQVESCDLTCNGNGRCEHGQNPHAVDNSADSILDMWNGGVQGYQYCVCDTGFAGANCEYEYIKCPDARKHYCFHGSTCVVDAFGKSQCECSTSTNQVVSGRYCEYLSTDTCLNPVLPSKHILPDMAMTNAQSPFCVNDGLCVMDPATNTFACECDETSWHGKRCEFPVTPAPAPTATAAPTYKETETFAPTIMGSVTEEPTSSTYAPTETYYPTSSTYAPTVTPYPTSSTFAPTVTATPTETEGPTVDGTRDPDREFTTNMNTLDEEGDSSMKKAAKFGLVLFLMAVIVTLGVVAFRAFERRRTGKEAAVGSLGNLDAADEDFIGAPLEMINERDIAGLEDSTNQRVELT